MVMRFFRWIWRKISRWVSFRDRPFLLSCWGGWCWSMTSRSQKPALPHLASLLSWPPVAKQDGEGGGEGQDSWGGGPSLGLPFS